MVTELTILPRSHNKNISEHELPSLCLTSGKGSDMGTPAWSHQRLCFKHQADSGVWCHRMSTCALRSAIFQTLQSLCAFKLLRRLLVSLARKFARHLSKKGLILRGVEGPQWPLLRKSQPTAMPSKTLMSNFSHAMFFAL